MFEKIKFLVLCNRFYCYSEYRVNKFIKRLASITTSGKMLLDVGAGQCRFKKYFLHTKYVAQDSCVGDVNWDFSNIDIKSEIYSIPVENQSFDYILCTEVLEHLKYPHLAFQEFERILKPRGKLFIVCPLTWKEHQKPNDFFRYTQYSLKMYALENNFEVVELNKIGGKYITLAQCFNDAGITLYMSNYKIFQYILILLLYPFKFFLGFFCYYFDKLDTAKDLTLQYEGIFEKKSS